MRARARIPGANSPPGHAIEFAGCYAGAAAQFMRMGGPVPAGERLLIQTPAFLSATFCAVEDPTIVPPPGLNSKPWTDEEKAAIKAAVATYKTRIRPLVRSADLYHILPRPDGKNWDGIQYHDPTTGKGVVYLFKPSPVADTITTKLRGVEPARRYRVSFEDGSNPTVEKTGDELAEGLEITLKGAPVSELVWIEEVNQCNAGRPLGYGSVRSLELAPLACQEEMRIVKPSPIATHELPRTITPFGQHAHRS